MKEGIQEDIQYRTLIWTGMHCIHSKSGYVLEYECYLLLMHLTVDIPENMSRWITKQSTEKPIEGARKRTDEYWKPGLERTCRQHRKSPRWAGFQSGRGLHVASLGADLCVRVPNRIFMTGSLWPDVLAGLAMGSSLVIEARKRSNQWGYFSYFFKVVTTNGKIIAKSDNN